MVNDNNEKIVYSINVDDIREVANQVLGRDLTKVEVGYRIQLVIILIGFRRLRMQSGNTLIDLPLNYMQSSAEHPIFCV